MLTNKWDDNNKPIGKLRRIGVSNFNIRHLEGLLADPTVTIRPAINQVGMCVPSLHHPMRMTSPEKPLWHAS